MVLGFIMGLGATVSLILGLMKWLNPMTWVLLGVKHILHALVLVFVIAGLVGGLVLVLAFFFCPMHKMCPLKGMCRVSGETEQEGGAHIPKE